MIVAGLKGGFRFAYLGNPLRFWRMAARPQTSWIAKGFIFVILFVAFAVVQLVLSCWLPGTAWEVLFKVLAGGHGHGELFLPRGPGAVSRIV